MQGSRFTEEQVIGILPAQEAGVTTGDSAPTRRTEAGDGRAATAGPPAGRQPALVGRLCL